LPARFAVRYFEGIMIALLSPTKTLDWKNPAPTAPRSTPRFLDHAAPVAEKLQELTVDRLAELFGVSEKTSAIAYDRMQKWNAAAHESQGRAALYAFSGPVYQAMDPWSFGSAELDYAQDRFLILSGLYGVLSPLDGILPYRLDMGAALTAPDGGKLTDYWKHHVTDAVSKAAGRVGAEAVLNLASREYVSAVVAKRLPVPLVECRFEEWRNGGYRQVRNRVKWARGLMASYLARSGATTLEEARRFRCEGYSYRDDRSDEATLVFVREEVA
jgi:cytoplasmic iron level regulating protein YaaA (DUF328/UPF0246 family)